MGAKTAPLRQGLRYGTRLISWLLSSHFWLFHLHTSCFPSGAIKAVIVCRSLPSAAWQRLMLMMTSGMMASNTDPLEWAVQLLVCRLKHKHYQSHRCHRIISNLDLCYPLGVLAMPKRKRRTSNGETVTVKLVTALNHYILWGVGVRVGSFPETYGMNITETVFYQSTNQVFHKSLDGSDGWQLCTMDPQDWRILARWRYQNIWKFMAACCIHQVFPVQSTPGKFDSTKPVRDHPQKEVTSST